MALAPAYNSNSPAAGLIGDNETLEVKRQLLDNLKANSLLTSISKATTFLAGVMLAAGMAIIGTALKDVAVGASLPTVIAAVSNPVGLSFLGVAIAATAIAVVTDYKASRIWQGGNFDNLEMNARSTAKHLVEQLKENNLCLTKPREHEQNQRADGKQWSQVVRGDFTPSRA
jgi:hypothetical protein